MDPVTLQIVVTLASQAMRYYAEKMDRAAAGHMTDAELDEMAGKLGVDIAGLRAAAAAKRLTSGIR